MPEAPSDNSAIRPAVSEPRAIPSGVVSDVSCMGCGYDLAGLSWSSCCPQCAISVESSVRSVSFGFGDLGHIKQLRLGANLIWVSALLRVAVVVGLSINLLALMAYIGERAATAIWGSAFVACLAVKACGCWLVTQPLVSSPLSDTRMQTSRLVYRAISVIEITVMTFGVALVIAGGWPSMPRLTDDVFKIAFGIWLLSFLAFNWYALSFLGKLRTQGPIGPPATTWAVLLTVLIVLGPLFGVGLFIAAVLCWMHLEVIIDRMNAIRKSLLQLQANRDATASHAGPSTQP